jgi:hypothetical protein
MISKVIIIFVFALFICSSTTIVTNVAAQSDTNSAQTANIIAPSQTFSFTIKRIREKISLTWLGFFNPKGLGSYSAQLTKERADELIYVSEHEKAQYIETAVSRLITQVGLLSEQYDAKNASSEQVLNAVQGYPEKLERLRDDYPSQTAQWILMQQAVDTVKVLASKVQEKK